MLRFNKWSNSFNNLTRSAAVLKCDFITFRLLNCWQAWHTIKSQDLSKCEMKWGHYHIFCDCQELLEFWQNIKDEVAVTKWWMLTSHCYKCIILYFNATAWFPRGWGWVHVLLTVQNPIYVCFILYNFNLIHSLERPPEPVLLLSDLQNPVNRIRILKCSSESPSVITMCSQSWKVPY